MLEKVCKITCLVERIFGIVSELSKILQELLPS